MTQPLPPRRRRFWSAPISLAVIQGMTSGAIRWLLEHFFG
jgi:predicted Holliday junction resolvase-like endonuclease